MTSTGKVTDRCGMGPLVQETELVESVYPNPNILVDCCTVAIVSNTLQVRWLRSIGITIRSLDSFIVIKLMKVVGLSRWTL